MQLILRPVSDSRLKEIIVTDSRFAIGRNEDNFKNFERSIVAKLSRRHARVFERDGQVFIADLHSSNGTTVNGENVEGEPVEIKLNDEIQFGGLRYRVEHLGQADAARPEAEAPVNAKIVLKPVHADGLLKPVVVSKFPFLVSRYSDAFARYQATLPEHLSFISKKHAHFFVHHNEVYIEDLDSTNGTYVSGEQLTEKARKLQDHETIAFGGDRFVFKVQIFVGEENIAGAEEKIDRLVDGTIFVDDATNFFEIYMGAGDDEEAESADVEDEKSTTSGLASKKTRLGRMLHFLSEVRSSIRAGEPIDRRLRLTIGASVACLAAGIGGYWYIGWPVKRVNDLMANQNFGAAVALADDYLRSRPEDERLQNLATEAAMKLYVPQWQQAIADGQYRTARKILENARQSSLNNSKDDDLIRVLELATEFSDLDMPDEDQGLSIAMLSGESTASDLVEKWDSGPTENARALSRIELQVDGFDDYRAGFFRKLRALRKRERDIEPLITLGGNLVAALTDRDTELLRQYVREFSEQHGDVNGLEALHDDLRRYEEVEQHIDDAKWLRAYERLNLSDFNTEPFIEQSAIMNEDILPDAETREAYVAAADAWKNGDTKAAFETLESLEQQSWGEPATRELERGRGLLNALAELQTNRNSEDFQDRLFDLYGKLDPDRDDHIRLALQPDFQRHSQAALDRATRLTRSAEQAWKSYDDSGRLQPVHRLQDSVSTEYKNLAGLLTDAYQDLRESEGIYLQLNRSSPENWSVLNREVVREIKLQTGALGNLLVIEPEVQKAKLNLLPNLSSG